MGVRVGGGEGGARGEEGTKLCCSLRTAKKKPNQLSTEHFSEHMEYMCEANHAEHLQSIYARFAGYLISTGLYTSCVG